jgi:bifunctional DNA-binding transcriptional regulator/antitoxin component of YhaV-PrlF toxin-antitoxin module
MRITAKGQVTIPQSVRESAGPQSVRESAGLMPGTDVEFELDNERRRRIQNDHRRNPGADARAARGRSRALG